MGTGPALVLGNNDLSCSFFWAVEYVWAYTPSLDTASVLVLSSFPGSWRGCLRVERSFAWTPNTSLECCSTSSLLPCWPPGNFSSHRRGECDIGYSHTAKHAAYYLKGRLTRGDMLQGHVAGTLSPRQIPSCERSIFIKNVVARTKFCPRDMSPEFKSVWIEGTCRGDKTTLQPGKRKVALCELFMRHVPVTLRKINQSENEITTCPCDKTLRVNTSRNLSPQHAPSCEQRMKFFPATCPCNMSPRVSRP